MRSDVIGYLPWRGGKRRYLVHLPPLWTSRAQWPAIFAFHGGGSDAESIRYQSRLDDLSNKYGVIVVYPDGYALRETSQIRTWNATSCCGPAVRAREDEIKLVFDLVEEIKTRHAADPSRLYATGFSNGAMLTHLLGAQLSRVFAAIAPVSGDMPNLKLGAPQTPCPIIYFQGKRDTRILWEGGTGDPWKGIGEAVPHNAAIEGLAWWRDANQSAREPVETSGPGYERIEYPATSTGASSILFTLPENGHQWPGGLAVPDLGPLESRVDASEIMWAFFRRFRR